MVGPSKKRSEPAISVMRLYLHVGLEFIKSALLKGKDELNTKNSTICVYLVPCPRSNRLYSSPVHGRNSRKIGRLSSGVIPVAFQVREIDLTAVLGERLRIGCFVRVSQV